MVESCGSKYPVVSFFEMLKPQDSPVKIQSKWSSAMSEYIDLLLETATKSTGGDKTPAVHSERSKLINSRSLATALL